MNECIDKSVDYAIKPIQDLAKKVLSKYTAINENQDFFKGKIRELFINEIYNPITGLLNLTESIVGTIKKNDTNEYLQKCKQAINILKLLSLNIEKLKTTLESAKTAKLKSRLIKKADRIGINNHFTIEEIYYAGMINAVKHMTAYCKNAQIALEKADINNSIINLDKVNNWRVKLYNDLVKIQNYILNNK